MASASVSTVAAVATARVRSVVHVEVSRRMREGGGFIVRRPLGSTNMLSPVVMCVAIAVLQSLRVRR